MGLIIRVYIPGKIKCYTQTCEVPDICPNGAKPIKAVGYCCEVCPTEKLPPNEKPPLCYSSMCRSIISMLIVFCTLGWLQFYLFFHNLSNFEKNLFFF